MPLPIVLSDLPPPVVHPSRVHQTTMAAGAVVQSAPPEPADSAPNLGLLSLTMSPQNGQDEATPAADRATWVVDSNPTEVAGPETWMSPPGAMESEATSSPLESVSATDTLAENALAEGASAIDPLAEDAPEGGISVADTPGEGVPGEGVPAEDTSAEAAPGEGDPAEAASGEDAGEDTSEEDVPADTLNPALLRLLADTQTFSLERQMVTASGNVLVQFGDTQFAAERVWVNLNNRYLRAEGDVFFNRNQQILEADTATYNLLQGSGRLTNGRGALRLSSLTEDLTGVLFPNDLSPQSLDYRLGSQGSISQVTSPGGYAFTLNSTALIFGGGAADVGRIRFEASQIDFDAMGWYGNNLRLTNDPFSPPELELRGNRVSFVPLSEEEDEFCIDNPRLVFDQGLSLPLVRRCYQLQRGQLPADTFNPLFVNIGYDNRDRDGLFIERSVPVFEAGDFQISLSPQIYLSRWLDQNDGLGMLSNLGLVARAEGSLGPRTSATGLVSLPGLDFKNFTNRVRANLRVQQLVGTHRLGVEYTYRDRLFNGSLGFQDVQTSMGVLLESPVIPLGETGVNLAYQLSGQYVTANTDQAALLDPGVGIGLTSLGRFQGAADLSRSFSLWQGTAKPSTATEGLRYSPQPVVPFLALVAGLRGVATYYTNGNLQESLDARVTMVGQLGHLARNHWDYTQFNLGISSNFIGGEGSPFLFDRLVDQNTLSGGIVQQIYGPVLLGFQTAFNLDTGQEIDTRFSVEYRRRTYGLVAQYSPTQETGFLGFRLSQFDWVGRPDPFDGDATNQNVQVR